MFKQKKKKKKTFHDLNTRVIRLFFKHNIVRKKQ